MARCSLAYITKSLGNDEPPRDLFTQKTKGTFRYIETKTYVKISGWWPLLFSSKYAELITPTYYNILLKTDHILCATTM